jgi:cell division protein FtsZ
MVQGVEGMSDNGGLRQEKPDPRDVWRRILAELDDHILRACLPKDPRSVSIDGDRLEVWVESEFKKEYCTKKLDRLVRAVDQVIGPRTVIIGEPPLVEQAREDEDAPPRAQARIAVLGVGDGGTNATDRMHREQLHGVRLVAVDTDRQVLAASHAPETLQIGVDITGGRGTGGDENKGRRAALESKWELATLLRGLDLVFVTAGLGGGTGSGAAPVIAELARDEGALTIGVVTKPFTFEGSGRMQRAEQGLARLRESADVLIVISNDRLLESSVRGLAMTEAFQMADRILHQGVRGISDLITVRGLVNLDFADIRSLLSGAGEAMMGMGSAQGDQRAATAARLACNNPLLEGGSIRGARKLIMNVTGGPDLTLGEVTEAASFIRRTAATESDLVFGAVVDESFDAGVQITVIAADFGRAQPEEMPVKRAAAPRRRIVVGDNLDVPTYLRRSREAPPEEPDEEE